MTSSLVGSEMCIRDSPTVVSPKPCSTSVCERAKGRAKWWQAGSGGGEGCLLYTSDAADDM
eukprot:2800927-Prorocentrum_lima.AAC.1